MNPLIVAILLGVMVALTLIVAYISLVPIPNKDTTAQVAVAGPPLPVPILPTGGLPVPAVPPPPVPALYRVATNDPVIFVTIDDGVFRPADAQEYIMQNRIPVTSFLTTSMVRHDPQYFATMQSVGETIANHTLAHPHMPRLSYTQQKDEICHAQDQLQQWFGGRPALFRPPYGELNLNTKRASAFCGIKRLVTWSVVLDHGELSYLSPSGQLEPGDIVLLHFRPELKKDLEVLTAAAQARGLHFASLPQYLGL